MNISKALSGGLRRLTALALAGGTLWAVAVTAGSSTASSAVAALRTELSSPLNILRWELGDVWADDTLSAATALTIAESPLLLSARPAVAELWSMEVADTPPDSGTAETPITTPVEEVPLDVPAQTDNGVTAKTLEQAQKAQQAGANYLGSGAVFGSTTKLNARPMTKELLQSICESVQIPVVAIGGIHRGNIAFLAGTGIRGAAVVSGIFSAVDIAEECRILRAEIDKIVK